MDSGKPDLLDVLMGKRMAPEIIAKIAAALVDGNGRAADQHVGVAPGVGDLHGIEYPADGTDGVPDADKMQEAGAAEGVLEALGDLKGAGHAAGVAGAFGEEAGDVGGEGFVAG